VALLRGRGRQHLLHRALGGPPPGPGVTARRWPCSASSRNSAAARSTKFSLPIAKPARPAV
jgi:hypothetical protein